MDQLEYWGRISLLKGGINDADLLTTVSRQYAREIQTAEFGFGFDGILRRRSADLVGILNGIDTTEWDPARDRFLPVPYDADDLTGKAAAKRDAAGALRPAVERRGDEPSDHRHDFENGRTEGLRSARGAGRTIWHRSTPRGSCSGPATPGIRISGPGWRAGIPTASCARIGFDEELAHLIEAGADLFLMPSRFEPCGLNQMYSLRYGTVPVVHGVGGLLDTVHDYDAGDPEATGFVFREYTPAAVGGGARAGVDGLSGPAALAGAAARRHASGQLLAPFGSGVRQNIRACHAGAPNRALRDTGAGTREYQWQLKTCRLLRTGISTIP